MTKSANDEARMTNRFLFIRHSGFVIRISLFWALVIGAWSLLSRRLRVKRLSGMTYNLVSTRSKHLGNERMPADVTARPAAEEKRKLNMYPPWAPRFWHGMVLSDWLRLLIRNRFRIHPLRWGLTFTVSCVTIINTVLRAIHDIIYRRAIRENKTDFDIIFIIGHWRSGTTLLHELLVLNDRFAFPTTYECFGANHFLLTASWLPKMIWFLLPSKRPMDDMAVSFDHPQEDEFALISLGAPSPLLRMAFPNDPPPYMEFFDMEGIAPADLANWQSKLRRFVSLQMHRKQKPIVLKSPTHTGRVKVLSEMFPSAKFIHITRNPFQLYSSTVRLWKALDEAQALQKPREKDLEEYVFAAFERMYGGFEKQRESIGSNRICDVRYEDLIRDPTGTVASIYKQLDLGDFESQRAKIEQSMMQRSGHKANRHTLPDDVQSEIKRRWGNYIAKYDYADE
jgi:hypothetical protein